MAEYLPHILEAWVHSPAPPKKQQKREFLGADQMTQWAEALAANLDDLSSVSKTHMVEREDQLAQVVL